MAADERWTAETEALAAEVLRRTMPTTRPTPVNRQLAVALLTALADAGLLLPPSGEVREEFGWSHGDRTECLTPDECLDAYRDSRRITEWPDGTELMTPWRPVEIEGAPDGG